MSGSDGGPAFAGAYEDVIVDQTGAHGPQKIRRQAQGMSLRDWFAGQALVGFGTWSPGHPETLGERSQNQARLAYEIADAMLKAREES